MQDRQTPETDQVAVKVYQIRIRGHLDPQWADWFGGLAITLEENGDTLLTGPVVDQAALFGLLKRVRDLGLPLISVTCGEHGRTHTSGAKKDTEQGEYK
jgi:hypothetical protein